MPFIKSIVPDQNKSGYTYVQIYSPRTEDYIHLWVSTRQDFSSGTQIVFYGISKSPTHEDSKIINRDYDYIFRKITTDKFERLIIDRLIKLGIT